MSKALGPVALLGRGLLISRKGAKYADNLEDGIFLLWRFTSLIVRALSLARWRPVAQL